MGTPVRLTPERWRWVTSSGPAARSVAEHLETAHRVREYVRAVAAFRSDAGDDTPLWYRELVERGETFLGRPLPPWNGAAWRAQSVAGWWRCVRCWAWDALALSRELRRQRDAISRHERAEAAGVQLELVAGGAA